MTDLPAHNTTVGDVPDHDTAASPDHAAELRTVKARLFGDDPDAAVHRQVIKARFLDALRSEQDVVGAEPVRIGSCTILHKLGQGGMGVVYVGYDDDLDRKVAIKFLRGELENDERGRSRMRQEAQALARLSHPNVVQVHAVGQWNGQDYVAMEYVDGQTLKVWLASEARAWREVLRVMIDAGSGLEAAHAAGLVHRDFKPANLLIGEDRRVRVLDFGLARIVGELDHARGGLVTDALEETGGGGESDNPLTVTGAVLGTPAYMAPEQLLGQRVDAASDQFSFCVVLYEALLGQRPFGTKRDEYIDRIRRGEFEPGARAATAPLWLRKAVVRGLAYEPSARWPSMNALLTELRRDRTRAWRGLVVGASVAIAVAGVFVAKVGERAEPNLCPRDPDALAHAWTDTQRDAVTAAFVATAVPEVSTVLDHTLTNLDAYADQLVDARVDACVARWVQHRQTDPQMHLRSACLDQRERELAAVVAVLTDADREVVLHAPELLAELGDVSVCARVDLLELGTPAARDLTVVARIAEVRETIAQAHAARNVGRIAEAKQLTAAAWAAAEPLGFEPLLGELHLLEGQNAQTEREPDRATEEWLAAVVIAQRNQAFELAANAWLQLAWAVERNGTRPDQSLEFKLAAAAIDRLGSPPAFVIRLAETEGHLLIEAGQAGAAFEAYDRALAAIEAGSDVDRRLLAGALSGRSQALADLGRTAEARADLAREIGLRGRTSRAEIDARFDLAVIELNAGELDTAEADMRSALRDYEALFGPKFASIGHGQLALVNISLARDDLEAADVAIARALEIIDAEHQDYDWALDGLASVHDRHGDHAAAVAALREAAAHRERVANEDHPRIAYLHLRTATMLRSMDRLDEALVETGLALDRLDRPDMDVPLDVAFALLGRGEALLRQGKLELARESLARAVELTPVDCGDARAAAESRILLAQTLHELGIDPAEQRELARAGVELLEKFPSSADMRETGIALSGEP